MSFLSRLARARQKRKQTVKVAWLGLDFAGKTTIIRKISTGAFDDSTKRTLGMNVDEFQSEGIKFVSWDIGGQETFRSSLWRSYMAGSQGIIFVVDSADSDRFSEARTELWNYVLDNSEVHDIPILILANKQDLPAAANAGEIARSLHLHKVYNHSYAIFPTSAKTAFNLEEALEWLRQRIVEILDKD
ncbi:MAG: GTPase HflX [Candidatus Heimdallarchaeota archaeon LC_3]|nr:MAG: GTPase HflX [Candidatus Heimdallarchaeota archaeon LC_3]